MTFYRSVFSLGELPEPEKPEICISGPLECREILAFNRLANKKHLARTSGTPGKPVRLIIIVAGDLCFLVDLPGYGYAKISIAERKLSASCKLIPPGATTAHRNNPVARFTHGVVSARSSYARLDKGLDGDVLYVFTKADKLSARGKSTIKKPYR